MNILTAACVFCVTAIGDSAQPAATTRPESQPAGMEVLWQIGKADRAASEFALAPDAFARFPYEFAFDPIFIVGRSDARSHWPFVHPGPVDIWTGSRKHTRSRLSSD